MPHIKLSDEYFIHLSNIATWNKAQTPVQAIEFLIAKEIDRLGLVYENPLDNLDEDDNPDEEVGYGVNDDQDDTDSQDDDDNLDEEDGYDLNDDQEDDDGQEDDDDLGDYIQIEEDQFDDDSLENEIVFEEAPDLKYTQIIEASINNNKLTTKLNWRNLLERMVGTLHSKGITGDYLIYELRKIRVKQGRFEENGYKYFPFANISIQHLSADNTWSEIERLSIKYKIPVRVTIMWSKKDKALHPGKIGKLKTGF